MMGWWTEPQSKCVIGDEPLDDAGDFLDRVSSLYLREVGRRPTADEFVRLVSLTLQARGNELLHGRKSIGAQSLVLKAVNKAKVQKFSPGDLVAILLKDKCWGCGQILLISPKMGPLLQLLDYYGPERPTLVTARASPPIDGFYTYVSLKKLRNSKWPVIGNAPPVVGTSRLRFVINDLLSDDLCGDLVIVDKVIRRATRKELQRLPSYGIAGPALLEKTLLARLAGCRDG